MSDLWVSLGGWSVVGCCAVKGGLRRAVHRSCDNAASSGSGGREVSCSASDAHYKVIQSIPLTSDLNRCNDNPKTQCAFSYRYTRGGVPLNEYVYCLVGIGSYARP
ncbi:hypothetical protein ACFWC9_14440 [Streptomyces goshikiensis]|uniref:LppU/SCO3897 family protein n=1 Tax=Streptomyces goshikiensis TaxID=1942 RepID=UPI00369D15E4